ncbi:MAG: fibrobacter succinogenes major paralogous domain-containing protein [Fibrobacter sp.]|nr:fibrobacter succinogenes major paralogous domain-containing protein [Fibrobacter sp.]
MKKMFSHLSGTAGVVLSLFAFGAIVACSESFTDERDGQSYDVVEIGGKTWMAENLNFDMAATGASENSASFCPEGDSRNCSKYGRLYTWEAAQNACPAGWRLPTREEFESLITVAGNGGDVAGGSGLEVAAAKAGAALKATSGWFKKGNGTDEVGFAALPAGYHSSDEKFDGIGGYAYFWSSATDPDESAFAQYLFLDFSSDAAEIRSFVKSSGYSVRCVRQ